MASGADRIPSITQSIRQWWREESSHTGFLSALRRFMALLWEFLRDSTPARRQQRYGDVEFDWDYRVDTTSATVGWRDRLTGLLHSPYQPTDPALFREMLACLEINFREFTFIDIGSGKGRVLLLASDYPFRRIIGIELLPELHRIALKNVGRYKSDSQRCFEIECVLGDASAFAFPAEPIVLYLFNPLPEAGLVQMIGNLERSFHETRKPIFVLYHNPLLEHVLSQSRLLKTHGGTPQYSVYASAGLGLRATE